MNNPKTSFRMLLPVLCVLVLSAISTFADPIQLTANTAGVFTAGSSGATVSNGGRTISSTNSAGTSTITFSSTTPQLNVAVNSGEGSNITLGVFNVSSTAASGSSGPGFGGANFALTVSFTVPSGVAPQTFNGTLTGSINQTASGAVVQWTSPTTLTFNTPNGSVITLNVESFTTINPPGAAGAANPPSEIRGRISVTAPAPIPEPATLVLMGSGLAGLAAVARRRRAGKAE
jgi:hypothetical protein